MERFLQFLTSSQEGPRAILWKQPVSLSGLMEGQNVVIMKYTQEEIGIKKKISNFHFSNVKSICCFSPSPPYSHMAFAKMLGDVIFSENIIFSHVRVVHFS